MHETLHLLIERFRAAQDLAVATLLRLGIPQPSSGIEWLQYSSAHRLRTPQEREGVRFYAHGLGIDVKMENLSIDFDWGPNGEPDGFDGWRLFCFANENLPKLKCSFDQIKEWLENALSLGELIKTGNLYFDPKRRAYFEPGQN